MFKISKMLGRRALRLLWYLKDLERKVKAENGTKDDQIRDVILLEQACEAK